MNRLEFSCLADFFVRIFKTIEEIVFFSNPPVEGTVNSMEEKTRVFCKIDVQEFHLSILLMFKCTAGFRGYPFGSQYGPYPVLSPDLTSW
jgi:hypothetical protein